MNVKQLVRDDDAVSPVIGVILMVAITVILAAVIGAFVLGIGGDLAQTPNSNLAINPEPDFDDTQGTTSDRVFFIDQQGGDTLQADDIRVIVRDSNGDTLFTFDSLNDKADQDGDGTDDVEVGIQGGGSEFGVGDRADIDILTNNSGLSNGDEITIQMVHKPSDGVVAESTITLAS